MEGDIDLSISNEEFCRAKEKAIRENEQMSRDTEESETVIYI